MAVNVLRHFASHRPQQQNNDSLYVKHRRWCNTQMHNEVFGHKQITLLRMFIIWQLVSTSSVVLSSCKITL